MVHYERGSIQRVYDADGWGTTLMLVNAIGFCAEAADHHPDLTVSWGRVTVALSTHSAKGIIEKDFELARQCDEVARWRPAKGSAHGDAGEVRPRRVVPSAPATLKIS